VNIKKLVEYEHFKTPKQKLTTQTKKPSPSIGLSFKKEKIYDDESNDEFSDIVKGKGVYHETFGKGVVIGVQGRGKDKKADILFEDCGLKKIILKYAKLRVNLE
jgi:DNA helicase-2/ATP-dependent DNA helicase PcrA